MAREARIYIENVKQVQQAMRELAQQVTEDVGATVQLTALEMASEVRRKILRGPKTGRVYWRGKNRDIRHVASAPGQPPATDGGALASSVYYESVSLDVAIIGSRLPYAYYLEFGTLRIKKRPAWIPAVKQYMPILQQRVEAVIRKGASS